MINMLLIILDGFYYAFTGKHFIRDCLELLPAICVELFLEMLLIGLLASAVVGGQHDLGRTL